MLVFLFTAAGTATRRFSIMLDIVQSVFELGTARSMLCSSSWASYPLDRCPDCTITRRRYGIHVATIVTAASAAAQIRMMYDESRVLSVAF